jgi:hypothetical protein
MELVMEGVKDFDITVRVGTLFGFRDESLSRLLFKVP